MVADVVERESSVLRCLHRLVTPHRRCTPEVPEPDRDLVGAVAVGADERDPIVARQQHRTVESDEVRYDPWGDDQARYHHRGCEASEPIGACQRPEREHDRDGDEHNQERDLGSCQRAQPGREPDEVGVAHGWSLSPPVHGDEEERDEQRGERVRHDQRIVHPEVRIDGCDHAGDDAGSRSCDQMSEIGAGDDRRDADDSHAQTLRHQAVGSPRDGCHRE